MIYFSLTMMLQFTIMLMTTVYHMLTMILTSSKLFWNAILRKSCIGLRLIRWNPILQNFRVCSRKNKNVNAEDVNIIVDNDTINITASMNVLGINIDDKLNFNSHVSNMCNKAGRQLNVLQRLKGSLDYASRLSIYKSFIMSNYCPVVWMFTSKSSLTTLGNIQRRALRFVLDDYTSDYHELLNKADVPGVKIMELRYLAIGKYTFVNGLNPKYLNDLFTIKKCKYDFRDDQPWCKIIQRLRSQNLESPTRVL